MAVEHFPDFRKATPATYENSYNYKRMIVLAFMV
jgi:hypothetical protein